jgi:hypothetical protein
VKALCLNFIIWIINIKLWFPWRYENMITMKIWKYKMEIIFYDLLKVAKHYFIPFKFKFNEKLNKSKLNSFQVLLEIQNSSIIIELIAWINHLFNDCILKLTKEKFLSWRILVKFTHSSCSYKSSFINYSFIVSDLSAREPW